MSALGQKQTFYDAGAMSALPPIADILISERYQTCRCCDSRPCGNCFERGPGRMIVGYEISLATPDDIPGILTLQKPNLIERGGGLSVRQTADWFRHAILDKSLVVGRRDGKVVGYVMGTSMAANAHIHNADHAARFPSAT